MNYIKQKSIVGKEAATPPEISYDFRSRVLKSKLNIDPIGVNYIKTNHLSNPLTMKAPNIAAICNIDSRRIEIANKKIKSAGKKKPLVNVKDDYNFRSLLKLSEIDALMIPTPWVWNTTVISFVESTTVNIVPLTETHDAQCMEWF